MNFIRLLLLVVALVFLCASVITHTPIYGVIGAATGFAVSVDGLMEDLGNKDRRKKGKLLEDGFLVCLWATNIYLWWP